MENPDLFSFLAARYEELLLRTGEHLMLTCVSTVIAVILGIAFGIAAFRAKSMRGPLLALVGILQTVPSLAMLVFLMTISHHIGATPALIALTLYALLPVVRNTLTGLENVPESAIQAARGLGMTEAQELYLVRIPIASPMIMAGIRTAAVVGVGIATLAAFIGAGGLGEFINRGLALSDTRLILLGAIPALFLAILVDSALGAAEWGIKPFARDSTVGHFDLKRGLRQASVALPFLLLAASLILYGALHWGSKGNERIRVGSKHFSEQLILGELISQVIERSCHLKVDRRFNLGGTMICHGALVNNEIDIYPEYTGTSLAAILKKRSLPDRTAVLRTVSDEYKKKFDVTWLPTFGFNNTWALITSPKDQLLKDVRRISDLKSIAPNLQVGLTAEFAERPDGYPGLVKVYDIHFGRVKDLDPNLAYSAVAGGELDLAAGNSTDGRIKAFGLEALADDRKFFPPYEAAPVIRNDVLAKHPEINMAFKTISGTIDDSTMQRLNYEVDGLKRSPSAVVQDFLAGKKTHFYQTR
jgi:osmoprotectant transport system permease protein